MKRIAVKSTNVISIGFNAEEQVLEIEFHDGSVYQYFEVPASVYRALLASKSKGGFIAQEIKRRYRYEKK